MGEDEKAMGRERGEEGGGRRGLRAGCSLEDGDRV